MPKKYVVKCLDCGDAKTFYSDGEGLNDWLQAHGYECTPADSTSAKRKRALGKSFKSSRGE